MFLKMETQLPNTYAWSFKSLFLYTTLRDSYFSERHDSLVINNTKSSIISNACFCTQQSHPLACTPMYTSVSVNTV